MTNGSVAEMVPQQEIADNLVVLAGDMSPEQSHRRMILNATALQEAALEEMSDEGLDHMAKLVEQFRADLAYCRGVFKEAPAT